MTDNRENFVIGMQYEGRSAAVDLANDLAAVERSLAELGRAGGAGSPFANLGTSALERLSTSLRQQFSAFDEARAKLEEARIRAENVAQRSTLSTNPLTGQFQEGVKGGFASENEMTVAQLAAARQISAAGRSVEAQRQKLQQAQDDEIRATEAVARVKSVVAQRLGESSVGGFQGSTTGVVDEAALQKRINEALKRQEAAKQLSAKEAERQAAADQKAADADAAAQAKIAAAEARQAASDELIAQKAQIQSSRLASVDAELAAAKVPTYASPDLTSHIGRAQASVNAAELNLEIATRKYAEELVSADRTVSSVQAADKRRIAAANALAGAEERLTVTEGRYGQGGASLLSQFQTGFKGVSDRPYAEQIGQAFKFSVLYGSAYRALSGITQTLQQTLQEGIAFQQAMTELAIASGQTAPQMEALRKQLGDQATQSGAAPSTGVLIGARSLGLFGATQGSGATVAQQNQIAEISARVVSRAAFGTGVAPEDLQRDLAAIAQAFQTGAQGQIRAYDLDAYLSKLFGQPSGSTFAAVAQSGTAGRAAGFSQEEVTAIAAELQARTGQDSGTIAGYMAQIFSRSGQGTLTAVEQKYGVDPTVTLAEQIKELAKIYRNTPSARDEISAVFGRGKSQNASIALLQGYPQIAQAAKDAQTQALGAGDRNFNLRVNNIGGQLSILKADLQSFSSELGRTGILDVFGAGVIVFRQLVEATTGILRAWDALDGVTKTLIATIVAEEVARRSGLLAKGIEAISPGIGTPIVNSIEAARINPATGQLFASQAERDAALAAGAGAGGAAEGGVLASIGSKLPALGAAAGAIASVIVAGQTINAASKLGNAQKQTTDLLNNTNLTPDSTSAQIEARAEALKLQADQAQEAAHGIFAHIIDLGHASQQDYNLASAANVEAARLQKLSQLKAAQEAQATPDQALISDFSSTGLSATLQLVSDAGGNATDRLNTLAASINKSGDAAHRAALQFDPKVFAGDSAQGIYQSVIGATSLYKNTTGINTNLIDSIRHPLTTTHTNILPDLLSQHLDPTTIQKRLQAALTTSGITSQADITPKIANALATSVLGSSPEAALGGVVDTPQVAKAKDLMHQAVVKYLLGQAKSVKDLINAKTPLSGADLTSTVNEVATETQGILGNLQTTDHAGRIATIQRQIRLSLAAIKNAPGGATSQVQDQLDAARRALSNEQISQLEDLRRAAQHAATSKAQIASIGRSFLTKEVNNAVRANNQDKLVELIGIAGNYGIGIARAAIQSAIREAQAAIALQEKISSFAASELAGIQNMMGRLPGGGAINPATQKRLDSLQSLLHTVNNTAAGTAGSDVYATGSDSGNPLGSATSPTAATPGPTAAQIAAARQSALAAGSESQIAQARAAMASARADMAAAKKGTVEYYSALSAYLTARNSLTSAIQQYQTNLYLLNHDATDPIVQAQAQLRAAQAKLRSDAGKPADVQAADRVAAQSAQASLESTKFQQRLDAVTTAESLGQISHRAYISYLDNEQKRLEQIKHRTYQQQQELNSVDQALKAASDSMQGIFNFGSINIPKPYQVQRYIAEQTGTSSGVGVGSGGSSTRTTTVYVDGADTGKIKKILRDEIGGNVRLVTTTPRHR